MMEKYVVDIWTEANSEVVAQIVGPFETEDEAQAWILDQWGVFPCDEAVVNRRPVNQIEVMP